MFKAEKFIKMFEIMEENVRNYKADILYDLEYIESFERKDYFIWALRPTGTTIVSLRNLVFNPYCKELSFEDIKNKLTMHQQNKSYYILDFNNSKTEIYTVSIEDIDDVINKILFMKRNFNNELRKLLSKNQSQKDAMMTLNNNNYFYQLVSKYFTCYLS